MRTSRTRFLVAGAAALALGLSACSGSADATGDTPSSSAGGDPVVAAADPSLLPYNFLGEDGSTWEGINVDLAAALSEQLGRPVEMTSAGFDTIIPGLASGRYDMALTGMFDTKERQQTVDFVDYLLAENTFLTRSDFRDVASMDDLCGEVVGIPGGALEAGLLADASTACTDAGEPAITVNEFADLDATVLALKSGRIDITPNDSAANAYILSQSPDDLKTSGGYLNEGYFAAAFPKDSDLTAQVEEAFAAIMADGTYAAILEDWGIPSRAMDEPIVNGSPF
ncbi:ABC transporter substrate-binding protein [Cellulomonas sp. C5510]|uniref:ABC transporter substrate-binding protein n=1 Tax=Cellulomonas sp. C5510 TaxID=2871170 RepID=UPI001C969641|nr:ABC transporter substrate-binding protein [Cellulomonas sp. C5510]QZN86991.1 ABC transporter substrate-binding protein [Cellulomonas sp. C5510]